MTTVFTVTSICDHKTKITATCVGSNIEVIIDSSCEKIQYYGALIEKMKLKDIAMEILRNPIYVNASKAKLHPNCLVPCGVAFCTWAEAGLLSKNLLSKFPSQCLIFNGE